MTKTMSGNQQMEEDTLVQEECSSEDPPHLSELKWVVQTAKMEAKDLKNHHPKARPIKREKFVPLDFKESVLEEWEWPGIPPEEFEPE